MPKQPKWRKLLGNFIEQLRIVSREESIKPGERGTKVALWNSQRRILDELATGMDQGIRRFYVLKSRQLGSTTVFVILALFWLAMHPKMKGALVVDQEKTRDDFREVIRNIIESIPEEYGAIRIKKGGDNKVFMTFTNGSQLNFLVAGTSGSKEAWGESSGYAFVLLTEIANYGSEAGLANFEEAMSDDNPDRLYVYESTAKGYNHWRQRWLAARDDPYTTRCIFVGWWSKELNVIKTGDPRFIIFGMPPPDERERELIHLVKERYGHEITPEQLAWIRFRMSKAASESSVNQNQPWVEEQAFVLSGRSYFQTRLVANDLDRMTATPYRGYRFWLGADFWSASIEHLQGEGRRKEIELRIWQEPMPEGRYVIGCDPAGGSDEKNDRHAISVWRCYADKLIQVAEYADNIAETRHCAWVLAYLAGIYRNCQIILELGGGYGKAVMVELEHLRELLRADLNRGRQGPNKRDWSDFLDNARWYIYRRPDSPAANGYIVNFQTTGDLKRQVFSEFRDSHINRYAVINSRPMLEEMMTIVQDGDSIGAPNHQKDDRTIASCLANHAWVQEERPGMLMRGETFEAITRAEQGKRGVGSLVDRIVAEHFRQIQNGVTEQPPERHWQEQRGLI